MKKLILFAIIALHSMATEALQMTELDITMPAAGTLKDFITPEQQEIVTKLKVSGDINGDDLRIIRHMIGAQVSSADGFYNEVDSGACRVLDLADANIIGEGFYTFKYVPKPSEGPAYYLPGLEVEANKITYAMFCGSKVEALILPNSVTYIGCTHRGTTTADHCIDGSRLKSITLPSQLEHMAIYGTGLALRHRDEGPDYYEEVQQQNLLDSPNLAEVKIAESNPNFKIIDGVLYRGDLTELMLCPPKREGRLEIPAETTKIGYRACAATHITGDLHITSPDIAPEAFTKTTIDGHIFFSNDVKLLPEKAFFEATINSDFVFNNILSSIYDGKKALANLTIAGDLTAENVDAIPAGCFYQVIVGGNLTPAGNIREEAFSNATVRGSLILDNVSDSIHARAFYALAGNDFEIVIPPSLRYIGDSAFCRASTTGTLIVPETLESLCVNAFAYNGFDGIEINSVTSYGAHYEWGSRYALYTIRDPFSFSKNIKEISIPYDMSFIPDCLFSHCSNLETINMPSGLKEIGQAAFWDSSGIKEIIVPSPNPTFKIHEGAFCRIDFDTNHRKVLIPENVGHNLYVTQTVFTPNDTVFLWLSSQRIAENIELQYPDYPVNFMGSQGVYYSPWFFYNYGYYSDAYEGGWVFFGATPDQKKGTGILYVPKGCKDKLISYLNSIISVSYPNPRYTDEKNLSYPTFLYFKEIREFTDLGYPNYSLEDSSVEGISKESNPATEAARYDINGRLLNKPAQGINIVRYSDGTVKKELVK